MKLSFCFVLAAVISSASICAAQQFSDFPALRYSTGSTVFPDFSGRDKDYNNYRTRIRDGLSAGPNFAGHYSLIEIGCGTSCRFGFVADNLNGQVFKFPLGGEENYALQLKFNLDSQLVKTVWQGEGDNCINLDLVWDGLTFQTVRSTQTNLKAGWYCDAPQ